MDIEGRPAPGPHTLPPSSYSRFRLFECSSSTRKSSDNSEHARIFSHIICQFAGPVFKSPDGIEFVRRAKARAGTVNHGFGVVDLLKIFPKILL